jgi:6-pyruvoyltetrahydropterin/6-carboxytetrahydropterin synthase
MNPAIARRRQFSTAHLYNQQLFTPQQNLETFGACYSKYGHGHNYTLEIFVEGPIDPENGLVINVNDLDAILKVVCEPFDHKHISFEHPVFKTTVPTTENLTQYFYEQVELALFEQQPQLKLNRIRLFETDDLWSTARAGSSVAPKGFELTREFVIRSIHHLENAKWTASENKDFYGICYGTHGHDYRVQVTCGGTVDPATGLTLNRDAFDALLEKEIRSKYDGVDLNKRFKNTSCEQLAVEFYQILKPLLPNLKKIGIQETRKNYFEFPPVG